MPPLPPSVPVPDAHPSGPPGARAPRRAAPAARLRLSRRRGGAGAVLSFVVHGVVILSLVRWGTTAIESGGGGLGPRGGGAGGVEFFALPAPSAIAVVDLPPAPTVVAPAITVPAEALTALVPIALPPAASVSPDAAPGGAGTGEGAGGTGGGTGGGVGTETGSGTGGDERYIFPPNPRGVIVPPENPPKAVRGRALRVQFWVSADGRVERVVVTPQIPDEKYRRDFHQRMLNYRFSPAKTRDGRSVAQVVVITITP